MGLTDTVALLANEARFFRFWVIFGACSFQNEVGDPPFFLPFGKSRSLPFYVASLKKVCAWKLWGVNVLKIGYTGIPYEEGWWCQYHIKVGFFFRSDAFYDVSLAKSKQYYNLLTKLKATLPNAAKKLKDKFSIEKEDLSEVYLLPIKVCIEMSLRDFHAMDANLTQSRFLFQQCLHLSISAMW